MFVVYTTFFSMPNWAASCRSIPILVLRTGLRPDLADVLPVRRLGVDQSQGLHHLLGPLARGVAPDRQDHDLVRGNAERLADRDDLGVVPVPRDEHVRIAADGKDLDVVAREPVADVDALDPFGGRQDQAEPLEHLPVVGHVAVGHQPGDGLDAVTLRVQDQVRRVAPVADPQNDVGLEPAVVPFLFLGRLEVDRVNGDPQFLQAPVQKMTLRRQARRRRRVVVQKKHFHALIPPNCRRARVRHAAFGAA